MSGIHDNGHAALLLKIWQYLQKCITTLIFFVGFDYIILACLTQKGNSQQILFCTSFVFFYKQYGIVLCHPPSSIRPWTWHTLSDMSKRSCAETPEAKSHFKALHIRALKLVIFGDGIRQMFAALRHKPPE